MNCRLMGEELIEHYLQAGAKRVKNLIFSSETEPSPCVPATLIQKKPTTLARKGLVLSSTGFAPARQCELEPLVVEFTENTYDRYSPTVRMELMWVAPVTGSIYREDGSPLANNSTLHVEWTK